MYVYNKKLKGLHVFLELWNEYAEMIVTQCLRVCYSTHLLFGNFLKEIKVTACTKLKSYIPYEILPTLFFKS